MILQALRDSNGGALTVSDNEIIKMMSIVASLEGMFVCPEGAATAVALDKLLIDGLVKDNEKVLLLNTGSGLKYLDVLENATQD